MKRPAWSDNFTVLLIAPLGTLSGIAIMASMSLISGSLRSMMVAQESNRREAIERFREHKPDATLNMPGWQLMIIAIPSRKRA